MYNARRSRPNQLQKERLNQRVPEKGSLDRGEENGEGEVEDAVVVLEEDGLNT